MQILRQVGRAGIARRRITGHRLVHDRLQVARQVRHEGVQRRRRLAGDLTDQARPVRPIEGRPQRQQLVQSEADRVHVAAGVGLARESLRGHVPNGANDVARLGQVGAVGSLGQAKVGDPQRAVGVEQQVGRLDVAVQHALAVRVRQPFGGLHPQECDAAMVAGAGLVAQISPWGGRGTGSRRQGGYGPARRGRIAARESVQQQTLGDALRHSPCRGVSPGCGADAADPFDLVQHDVKSLTLDELHGVVTGTVLLADAVDWHDVGMVQPGHCPRLAAEALQETGPPRRAGGQHLQSDAAAERFLLRLVHHAHAAAAYLAQDAKVAQPFRPRAVCRQETGRRGDGGGYGQVAGRRLELLHQRDGVKHFADVVGQFRRAGDVFVRRELLAAAPALTPLFGQLLDGVAIDRCHDVFASAGLTALLEESWNSPEDFFQGLDRLHITPAGFTPFQAQDQGRFLVLQLLEVTQGQHFAVERVHLVEHVLQVELQVGALGRRPGSRQRREQMAGQRQRVHRRHCLAVQANLAVAAPRPAEVLSMDRRDPFAGHRPQPEGE